MLDPGIGFGKTLADNLRLMRELPVLAALGPALLVGVSRKSMIGSLTGRKVEHRLAGSLAAALAASTSTARAVGSASDTAAASAGAGASRASKAVKKSSVILAAAPSTSREPTWASLPPTCAVAPQRG